MSIRFLEILAFLPVLFPKGHLFTVGFIARHFSRFKFIIPKGELLQKQRAPSKLARREYLVKTYRNFLTKTDDGRVLVAKSRRSVGNRRHVIAFKECQQDEDRLLWALFYVCRGWQEIYWIQYSVNKKKTRFDRIKRVIFRNTGRPSIYVIYVL